MMTDFEKSFAQLESIVTQMETESLDLEASLKAFEAGMALCAHCQKTLESARQRVEIIMQNAASGNIPYEAS